MAAKLREADVADKLTRVGRDGDVQHLKNFIRTHPAKGFTPRPYYSAAGDCLIYYATNEDCYAQRVNELLTVYLSMQTRKVVGCKIKGVRHIIENSLESFFTTKERLSSFVPGAENEPEPVRTGEVREFLRRVHGMSDVQDENAALDEVVERFEGWLEAGDWWACNKALAAADVNRLLPTVSLGILSMTLVEKNRLSASRPTFYRRLRRRIAALYGEQEANDDLLGLD